MPKFVQATDGEIYPVRRVLIDVTDTVSSRVNTGIQRVCRSLCRAARYVGIDFDVECIPVSVHGDAFYRTNKIFGEYAIDEHCAEQLAGAATKLGQQTRRCCAAISPSVDDAVCRVATRFRKTLYPKSLVRSIATGYGDARRKWFQQSGRIVPKAGDVLVLVDSSWNHSIEAGVVRARENGCLIVPVVHDLIPIHFEEFHQPIVRERFEKWFAFLVEQADHFLSVSQATSDDVRDYIVNRRVDSAHMECRTFRLGANFPRIKTHKVREHVQEVFGNDTPTFLNVGTIEPRKNQKFLLDTFEQLWERGVAANLVLVGKPGWMSDTLQGKLRHHPMMNRGLFWIQDATDQEIAYLYRRSRAFLFPSITEGFGLPIVEALYHGIPVFASDTKVHREVGGDQCEYFGLGERDSFARLISDAVQHPRPVGKKKHPVLDWNGSCQQWLKQLTTFSVPLRLRKQVASRALRSVA